MSIDEDPEDYKQNKKLNLYFKFHGVTSNFNESLTNLYTHTHTPGEKRIQTKVQAWPARYRDLAFSIDLSFGSRPRYSNSHGWFAADRGQQFVLIQFTRKRS